MNRAKEAVRNNKPRPPEARISKIDSFGTVKIRFTNDLDIQEDVIRESVERRQLKSKGGGSGGGLRVRAKS